MDDISKSEIKEAIEYLREAERYLNAAHQQLAHRGGNEYIGKTGHEIYKAIKSLEQFQDRVL